MDTNPAMLNAFGIHGAALMVKEFPDTPTLVVASGVAVDVGGIALVAVGVQVAAAVAVAVGRAVVVAVGVFVGVEPVAVGVQVGIIVSVRVDVATPVGVGVELAAPASPDLPPPQPIRQTARREPPADVSSRET